MNAKQQKCYWCGKMATTREHVPPKCFFPESFEPDGSKINRSKLITVPACSLHNNTKGEFDEYLRNRIVAAADNLRAWENTAPTLRSMCRNNDWQRSIEYVNGVSEIKTYDENVCFAVESIVRALYYHEFGECLTGSCSVYYGAAKGEKSCVQFHKEMIKYYRNESQTWSSVKKGAYPDVFTYQFGPVDKLGYMGLLMCFYESVYMAATICNGKHKSEERELSIEEAIFISMQVGVDPMKLLYSGHGYHMLADDEKGRFIKE